MLHISLSIVKVSINSDDMGIFARLSGHLQLLYLADTIFWIKNDNFCSWDIRESCHSSFTSVSRCCCQDDNFVFQAVFLSCCHKVGQDRQGHILKGNGGAVEKFQVVLAIEFHKRSNDWRIKLAVIGVGDTVVQLFCCKVIQES